MGNIRKWLDKGDKTSRRIAQLLPILIRQARLETPITYGRAAQEIGVHHRATHHIAGYIGHTLNAVAGMRGWTTRPPPPLQSLVVNEVTGLPGSGIRVFMSKAYQNARSNERKRAVLKAVYADMKAYEHWDELCDLLGVPSECPGVAVAVEKARNTSGRGGEGPEHKKLKEYVATHPSAIGLPQSYAPGRCEYPLASGDKVDVVFDAPGKKIAVEVKAHLSSDGDIGRGLFQCLKYRSVLEAESTLARKSFNVIVLLVIGKNFPPHLIPISNSLKVPVRANVVPQKPRRAARKRPII